MVVTPSGVRIPPSPLVNFRIVKNLFLYVMKAKIFFSLIFLSFVTFLSFPKALKAQEEMDFEEFMGMMSETISEQMLDELSYQMPWDIKVTAYGYGDYSRHGTTDFVIAVKEKGVTPPGTVDVYFLENIGNTTFSVVAKKNYKIYNLNLEVAFLVKGGLCYVTNRDKSNWYFTSFRIDENDALVQIDREVYPMEDNEKAGK